MEKKETKNETKTLKIKKNPSKKKGLDTFLEDNEKNPESLSVSSFSEETNIINENEKKEVNDSVNILIEKVSSIEISKIKKLPLKKNSKKIEITEQKNSEISEISETNKKRKKKVDDILESIQDNIKHLDLNKGVHIHEPKIEENVNINLNIVSYIFIPLFYNEILNHLDKNPPIYFSVSNLYLLKCCFYPLENDDFLKKEKYIHKTPLIWKEKPCYFPKSFEDLNFLELNFNFKMETSYMHFYNMYPLLSYFIYKEKKMCWDELDKYSNFLYLESEEFLDEIRIQFNLPKNIILPFNWIFNESYQNCFFYQIAYGKYFSFHKDYFFKPWWEIEKIVEKDNVKNEETNISMMLKYKKQRLDEEELERKRKEENLEKIFNQLNSSPKLEQERNKNFEGMEEVKEESFEELEPKRKLCVIPPPSKKVLDEKTKIESNSTKIILDKSTQQEKSPSVLIIPNKINQNFVPSKPHLLTIKKKS